MKRLSLQSTCLKCGFGIYNQDERDLITITYVPASTLVPGYEHGCMLRRCPRCGYEWNELSLDDDSPGESE